MLFALLVAGSVLAGLALLVTAAFVAGRWFFVDSTPDEVHYTATDDGWRLAVVRYRAKEPRGLPVLLCHGIAANHLNLDLTPDRSLARALAAAGYDTWSVELRGRGLSTQPQLFNKFRYDWSFDEYVEKDAPAAIAEVLRATGAPKLHWVGFSIGGLIGYAIAKDPRIASMVCLAAPSTFTFQRKYLYAWPLRNLRWLKHRFLMRLLAPLAGYWRPKLLSSPENLDGAVIRRFLVNGAANFSGNEMLQYGDWLEGDHFRSIDHRRDYRALLPGISLPILVVAGNKDLLAPPPAVKDAYDAIGSAEKQLTIVSRGNGFASNYGHLDLMLGDSAVKDVYPLVVRWLDARHAVPPVVTPPEA
jgi:pimeloyl-ACP methyl ester carboxylesterase